MGCSLPLNLSRRYDCFGQQNTTDVTLSHFLYEKHSFHLLSLGALALWEASSPVKKLKLATRKDD